MHNASLFMVKPISLYQFIAASYAQTAVANAAPWTSGQPYMTHRQCVCSPTSCHLCMRPYNKLSCFWLLKNCNNKTCAGVACGEFSGNLTAPHVLVQCRVKIKDFLSIKV